MPQSPQWKLMPNIRQSPAARNSRLAKFRPARPLAALTIECNRTDLAAGGI
jgi:hypothetical protein